VGESALTLEWRNSATGFASTVSIRPVVGDPHSATALEH
jgi:hypothetical protein